MLRKELIRKLRRHNYLLKSDKIDDEQKKLYTNLLKSEATKEEYSNSLQFLSECLELYHDEKVIILVDEYDVPLERAYFSGYYNDMVAVIRMLFHTALKTNNSLNFAVITGCLRGRV